MSASTHEAERSCFACRQKAGKTEMLRLVVDEAGMIWPDLLQKAPGRGTYLCMQQGCLSRLNDKRLGALRQRFLLQLPQYDSLRQRINDALVGQIGRFLSARRRGAELGRDAVMHRMWKNGPLLVLLACDAGEALKRQIADAVAKRQEAGEKTLLLDTLPAAVLSEAFQREKLSVAAMERTAATAKMEQLCAWYGRLREAR